MEESLNQLILQMYEIGVVKFGNFQLKSGVQSPIYFDLRSIVSHPKLMNLLTDLFVELIQSSVNSKLYHVCGVPYTALPIATLVSSKTGIPMLIRRKEAKDYGTKKIIEGQYNKGDECIIIEDVITSGSSLIETVADLEKHGLSVIHTFVFLDREQGGLKNLQNKGIKVHVLTSVTKILNVLFSKGKIDEPVVNKVNDYISNVSLLNAGDENKLCTDKFNSRLKMTFGERANLAKNKLTKKIFELMEMKKSLLCLAADVTRSEELLKLASQIGPHIVVFKIHFDILENFTENTRNELVRLAKTFNFLIMEDRKFSDIANTVRLQYKNIKPWADLVTIHSIAGDDVLINLKSCLEENEEKGCFLVAELSCRGNLISKDYVDETVRMAENHSDFAVGLVCQSPELIKVPYLIQLTPGVRFEKTSDGLGQNYNAPEIVVLEKGADLVVVGRGITTDSNPEKAALIYKEKLWNLYEKRVGR